MSDEYWQTVIQEIERTAAALFPGGGGTVTRPRVRAALEQVAQEAYQQGQAATLETLLTLDDALEEINTWLQKQGQKPISKRRLAAIAKNRNARFGVGWKAEGRTNLWLFRPEEITALRPAINYRGGKKAPGGDDA